MSSSSSTNNVHLFGYVPTEWVCFIFLSLFGISTFLHIVQAVRFRLWWLIPSTIFCGFLELVGWSGRLWSSKDPALKMPFVIGVTSLIIAPTFLVAANFIILGRIIRRLGPQYSRLTPRRYMIIFVSCDIISLQVQAMGGVLASSSQSSQSRIHLGSHIALGGTLLQLLAVLAYCALAAEFISRYSRDRPVRLAQVPSEATRGVTDQALKRMLYALTAMTVFIVTRTLYRVVEFMGGRNGKVYTTEWYFLVFDGTMIALAMLTLNAFHPGVFLREYDYPSPTTSEDPLADYPRDYPKTGNAEMRTV